MKLAKTILIVLCLGAVFASQGQYMVRGKVVTMEGAPKLYPHIGLDYQNSTYEYYDSKGFNLSLGARYYKSEKLYLESELRYDFSHTSSDYEKSPYRFHIMGGYTVLGGLKKYDDSENDYLVDKVSGLNARGGLELRRNILHGLKNNAGFELFTQSYTSLSGFVGIELVSRKQTYYVSYFRGSSTKKKGYSRHLGFDIYAFNANLISNVAMREFTIDTNGEIHNGAKKEDYSYSDDPKKIFDKGRQFGWRVSYYVNRYNTGSSFLGAKRYGIELGTVPGIRRMGDSTGSSNSFYFLISHVLTLPIY